MSLHSNMITIHKLIAECYEYNILLDCF